MEPRRDRDCVAESSPSGRSRFEIETWDEEPCDEQEGAKLTRPRRIKTFHGNVEGRSAVELLMAYVSADGLAALRSFERVVGRVHGWSDSFVLHHSASSAGSSGAGSAKLSVVPGSGTGELSGLRSGEARITIDMHSFALEYELG